MKHHATFTLLALLGLVGLVGCAESSTNEPPVSAENPFEAAEKSPGTWHWIPVAETVCRDGSTTGFGVRLQRGAENLLIFLQGGGACYDARSCTENAEGEVAGAEYRSEDFANWAAILGEQGLFSISNTENPLAAWNHVFLPYCSGDLHAGARRDAVIEDVAEPQQFVGYQNVAAYLDLLAPYFEDSDEVILAGSSAGGFGVLLNYPQVASAFSSIDVTALVDAAPIIVDDAVDRSCFEARVLDVFNLRLPADCVDCRDYENGGLVNVFTSLARSYPDASFALASADADFLGVLLLNRESTACGGAGVNIFNYRFGLNRLRDNVLAPMGNWSTFFWGGLQHTFSQTDATYFGETIGGVSIAEWLGEVQAGNVLHLAP